MKKLLLSFVAVTVTILSVNAQRMTISELFTGANCPPCASNNPAYWSLCASSTNADKIVNLTYMAPIPSTDGFFQSRQSALQARQTYYAVPFAPWAAYNGNGAGTGNIASFNQTYINTQSAIASPFVITSTHYFNATGDTVFGTVKVKAVAATNSGKLKLRAAFTKTMNFTSSPGTNGTRNFPNVVRAMFTNTVVATTSSAATGGQVIKSNWATGDSVVYTYKGRIGKLDSALAVTKPFTKVDSNFFVWIQNDTTAGPDAKYIYVASKSTYQMPPAASVSNLTSNISDITIFPNPASNFVKVTCTLLEPSKVNVTILNILGQVVAQIQYPAGNTQFTESIALPNLSNGTYALNFTTEGGTVTKQFTVSR
jgi:hypothetical protein